MWWSALALFIVAGSTGALFRFGVAYGWTGGLALENVRHAHSHLMYFGWGTPALMVLIWRCLPTAVTAAREQPFRWVVGGALVAAILAYPPFLLFGYSSVQVGAARMPIAVVGAGLNIFAWYGFVGLYGVSTWRLSRTGALRLWDVAVGALVLATFGAWGLSLLPLLGVHSPLVAAALTHVFLDLFSEGWFVLGGVGVIYALLDARSEGPRPWSVWLVVLGLPFTFILGLSLSRLPVGMVLVGRAGSALFAVGLLALTIRLARTLSTARRRWLWGIPLACLLLKAGAQLAGSLIPGLWLAATPELRILYLHVMLLGFLTLGLVAAAQAVWQTNALRDVALFYATVGVLLGTLVPLTSWMPSGSEGYEIAAWMALGPVLAAGWLLVQRIFGSGAQDVTRVPFAGATADDPR